MIAFQRPHIVSSNMVSSYKPKRTTFVTLTRIQSVLQCFQVEIYPISGAFQPTSFMHIIYQHAPAVRLLTLNDTLTTIYYAHNTAEGLRRARLAVGLISPAVSCHDSAHIPESINASPGNFQVLLRPQNSSQKIAEHTHTSTIVARTCTLVTATKNQEIAERVANTRLPRGVVFASYRYAQRHSRTRFTRQQPRYHHNLRERVTCDSHIDIRMAQDAVRS